MIKEGKRDNAVSPRKQIVKRMIALVNDGLGDLDFENGDGSERAAEIENEWGKLANKYEELEDKVNEYLNEEQNLGMRKPQIISTPPKMTKEE